MAERRTTKPPTKKSTGEYDSRDEEVLVAKSTAHISLLADYPSDGPGTFVRESSSSLRPGASLTFYANGKPGTKVTVKLERKANTGGHNHPGGPTGKVVPASFTLGPKYPQNVKVVYTAPDASGGITLRAKFQDQTFTKNLVVEVPGLVALSARPSIVLTGSTSTHPANHYGTSAFVSKLEQLADAFRAEFQGKVLYVNDMSLRDGGLFDHKATWKSPHATHRDGTNADINSRLMSKAEKTFFKKKAAELGLSAVEHGDPLHWHISL